MTKNYRILDHGGRFNRYVVQRWTRRFWIGSYYWKSLTWDEHQGYDSITDARRAISEYESMDSCHGGKVVE